MFGTKRKLEAPDAVSIGDYGALGVSLEGIVICRLKDVPYRRHPEAKRSGV
jgi:hypothetical protein